MHVAADGHVGGACADHLAQQPVEGELQQAHDGSREVGRPRVGVERHLTREGHVLAPRTDPLHDEHDAVHGNGVEHGEDGVANPRRLHQRLREGAVFRGQLLDPYA